MKNIYLFIKGWGVVPIVVVIITCIMLFVACRKEDASSTVSENGGNNSGKNYSDYEKRMVNQLTGTSWNVDKIVDGTRVTYNVGELSFSANEELYYKNISLFGQSISGSGYWVFSDDMLCIGPNYNDFTPENVGGLVSMFGYAHKITVFNSSEMVWENGVNERVYFTKVSSYSGGGNEGDTSSSASTPYVIGFNFTATKSSITVKFMVNEKPTSASIKYGTSSPSKSVSATIINKQVSGTVSGLKAGTKYYFSCTVRNSSGSTTSDPFPAITNY